MTIAKGVQTTATGLYKKCPECQAALGDLYIGGVGDWKRTIQCLKCFHVVDHVPELVIHELLSERLDIPLERIRASESAAESEYQETVEDLLSFLENPLE
jgi:hypothetical protein